MVRQRHLPRRRHLATADQADSGTGVLGGAKRVGRNAVRAPVSPATRWMRVVSMASASVMAGRMVVSRRASIDLPAPGGASKRTLWSERLHHLPLDVAISTW